MGLLDDIDNHPPYHAQRCGVAIAKQEHPNQADEIEQAIGRLDKSARIISEVLAVHGINIKPASIARHRRHECLCHD